MAQKSRVETTAGISALNQEATPKHICVCICTYKRPHLLQRLLSDLRHQQTGGLFTYSVVVADNDSLHSAEPIVAEFTAASGMPTKYCVEPQQNIALARNKAVANAVGDFVAFIDDDEFPTESWLLTLFKACQQYQVDGVLGPVKPHFDAEPPKWIREGKFYERETYKTGFIIDWHKGRTNNVLLKDHLFAGCNGPFRVQFRTGEDQDFFRRMIDCGHAFVWCNEAVVFETVPPARWKRSFMLRRALLRGASAVFHPTSGGLNLLKSLIAIGVYAVALPFALIVKHSWFMILSVKLFDHLGKLLAFVNINPIKEPYVTE
jgi:succinoglycan biosynthesis protein ExoM